VVVPPGMKAGKPDEATAPLPPAPPADLQQPENDPLAGAQDVPGAAHPQPEPAIGAPSRTPQPPARAAQSPAPGTAHAGADHPAGANVNDPEHSPLRSVHTASLPKLLQQAASSLLVSTYQAGKLVIVRENEGKLNTHFRVYNRPMGLAHDGGRMALGTALSVEYYRNMPEVARKLEPQGRHDAAFLPRHGHITGNIDIHEMA